MDRGHVASRRTGLVKTGSRSANASPRRPLRNPGSPTLGVPVVEQFSRSASNPVEQLRSHSVWFFRLVGGGRQDGLNTHRSEFLFDAIDGGLGIAEILATPDSNELPSKALEQHLALVVVANGLLARMEAIAVALDRNLSAVSPVNYDVDAVVPDFVLGTQLESSARQIRDDPPLELRLGEARGR